MAIELEKTSEGCVLRIGGTAGVYEAAELRDQLRSAIAAGGAVRVDLSAVSGCDITLPQLLVAAWRSAAARGQDLECAAVSEPVRQVIAASGLGLARVFGHAQEGSK